MYKVLTLDKIDPQGLGHFPMRNTKPGTVLPLPMRLF